jgi:hypothetical protein
MIQALFMHFKDEIKNNQGRGSDKIPPAQNELRHAHPQIRLLTYSSCFTPVYLEVKSGKSLCEGRLQSIF